MQAASGAPGSPVATRSAASVSSAPDPIMASVVQISLTPSETSHHMIILGVILILLGVVLSIPVLYTIGVIVAIIGIVLWVLGSMGRAVGGRNHYW